jgi:alpha-L-rhamnosidase
MANVAAILGRPTESAKYSAMYEKRKSFFNKTFVNADKKTLGTTGGGRVFGGGTPAPLQFRVADTQTSYAVGLALDLFSDENKPYMIKNLQAAVSRENRDDTGVARPPYSLMTGFIGTSWIGNALSENGLSGSAYKVLQNDKYPSWLYAIDQGATTIWERLNGFTVEDGFGGNNSMNSFNHYSFRAVGQWMLSYSLGIRRDEAGFQNFILSPMPDSTGTMTSADGYYDSMYGRIESSWKVDHGVVHYAMTVPPNTTATLDIPGALQQSIKIVGDARGAVFVQFKDEIATYHLTSGTYDFETTR